MDDDMAMLELCKYMGWDYWTYLSQPRWFVELCSSRFRAEGIVREKNNQK
jgi:hypothetical protein